MIWRRHNINQVIKLEGFSKYDNYEKEILEKVKEIEKDKKIYELETEKPREEIDDEGKQNITYDNVENNKISLPAMK